MSTLKEESLLYYLTCCMHPKAKGESKGKGRYRRIVIKGLDSKTQPIPPPMRCKKDSYSLPRRNYEDPCDFKQRMVAEISGFFIPMQ